MATLLKDERYEYNAYKQGPNVCPKPEICPVTVGTVETRPWFLVSMRQELDQDLSCSCTGKARQRARGHQEQSLPCSLTEAFDIMRINRSIHHERASFTYLLARRERHELLIFEWLRTPRVMMSSVRFVIGCPKNVRRHWAQSSSLLFYLHLHKRTLQILYVRALLARKEV